MLGPAKPRRLDEPIAVSLNDLVPTDHFYRHLEAKLDLSCVRDWTRELYAERGRPSIDPVVFFKLQLVMFFEGIRSERKLIETASLNLGHRWYLGYALDEALPDHSSLTRIRQRLGIGVFQRFFEQVVDLCQDMGLVWGHELYVDATKVEANAALDSLVPRFSYAATAHVAGLFADDASTEAAKADPEAAADALPVGIVRLPSAAARPPSIPRRLSSTAAALPSATPAPPRPLAPRASTAGSCTGPSPRSSSTGCAATTRRRRTRRPCASGRSGSRRSSPRPSSGTGYAVSDSVDSRTLTSRGCSSRPDRTSSACWPPGAGDAVMPHAGAWWPFRGSQGGSWPSTGDYRTGRRLRHW
jgi:transposase